MKDNNYINDMSLSKGAGLTGVSRSGINTCDDNSYNDDSHNSNAQSNKNPKNITVEHHSENIPKKIKEQPTYMMKNKILLPVLAALSTALFSTTSMSSTSTEFTSQDWQVACDNTRTCRLAGYQAENNSEFPVSILLVRRAGANAGVDGKIKLGGAKDSSSKALMQLGNRHRISLFINDKDYGETKPYSAAAGNAELTQAQVTALLEALTKSSKITLALRNSRWQLSDKGASAAMLKADEFQGRVGTSSAFIKNDDAVKSSGGILPPKAAPVLRFVVPSAKADDGNDKNFVMKSSQLASLVKGTMKDADSVCPNLSDKSPWRISRLNGSQLLAQHECWTGAYNAGAGVWVINDSKPYKPTLVTTNATGYDKGKLTSVQKGRGIGDCMSKTDWLWTGRAFEKSHESTTGLCRLIEAGGAWQLPTYVTEVKVVR